ncbi:MAG: hypothetical protein KC618_01510 [Candidatus Omnitrophica bacterium]|nr:hypothetical protein [Candidatus Omnitrophota bacterium]
MSKSEITFDEVYYKKVGDFIVLGFDRRLDEIDFSKEGQKKPEVKSQYKTFVVIDKKGNSSFSCEYDEQQFGEKVTEFINGEWEFEDEELRVEYESLISDFEKYERCHLCQQFFPRELMHEVEITVKDPKGEKENTFISLECLNCQPNNE